MPSPSSLRRVAPLARALERHAGTFRREVERLPDHAFQRWPDEAAFTGHWLVCPFFLSSHPESLRPDEASGRACASASALARLRGIESASFSRILPRTHIYEHVDAPTPGVLRLHVGLRVPEGSWMRLNGEDLRWEVGRVLVMNGQDPHEVVNLGTDPRDILIVDVRVPD